MPDDSSSTADARRPGGRIANEEFFGTGPTPPPPPPAPWSDASPPPAPDASAGERIDAGRFFRKPSTERPASRAWLRKPLLFGATLTGVGLAGVLVGSLTLLHDIVLVAPIFEELFKFGLALLLVAVLRVGHPVVRVLLALLPGLGFGVMEHFVTYADEPLVIYAFRVAFHSGATALSMSVYTIIEPLADTRARLFATVPSTVIHWLNNWLAVVFGVVAFAGVNLTLYQLAIGSLLAGGAHVAAWGLLLVARPIRRFAASRLPSLDPFLPPAPSTPEAPPTPPSPPAGRAPSGPEGPAAVRYVAPGPASSPSTLAGPRSAQRALVRKVARPARPAPRPPAPPRTGAKARGTTPKTVSGAADPAAARRPRTTSSTEPREEPKRPRKRPADEPERR